MCEAPDSFLTERQVPNACIVTTINENPALAGISWSVKFQSLGV